MGPQTKPGILIILGLIFIAYSNCCDEVEWSCNSGDCILEEQLCDGTPDCNDGSDETADSCIYQSCPWYAFRCAYGACVPADSDCDGIQDCADNSDEVRVLCYPDEMRLNDICLEDEFQCDSGQCIHLDDVCDGQANCLDTSDESLEVCGSNMCASLYFRCGYGACIQADHKCDGVQDCLDGSDEAFSICGDEVISRPVTTRPTLQKKDNTSCIAPYVKNSRVELESDPLIGVRPGKEVPNFTSIKYNCRTGFHRDGPEYNYCLDGAWFSEYHPSCNRYCPSEVLKGATFSAKCERDGTVVLCNDRIKPGTVANIECVNKYIIPNHNPPQTLLCEEDGQWNYSPFRCEQNCEVQPENVTLLVNGKMTSITSVPWNIGVYKWISGLYKHHCGGSLITPKVVISAAQCFWDKTQKDTYNKALFVIGAGKYFRDYYTDESTTAQFQNISHIAIAPEFNGENANLTSNIVLVVLTNSLILTNFVLPICIKWHMDRVKYIPNYSNGLVAGYGGANSDESTTELKIVGVSGRSLDVCRDYAGLLMDSITNDTFCVLNNLNTNVCQIDTGGGFVMKTATDGKIRYHLEGVKSYNVPNGVRCKHSILATFTNLQHYEIFITDLVHGNRQK